jgi:hypothetical protein
MEEVIEEMTQMDPFEAMEYFTEMTGLEPDYIEGAIMAMI